MLNNGTLSPPKQSKVKDALHPWSVRSRVFTPSCSLFVITDNPSQSAAVLVGGKAATIHLQSMAHSGELTVFLFFSVMFRRESVKKLCTCETFAMVSTGSEYRFFFYFSFSILFLMTMITFVAVLIFGGDGLSRSRLLCVKNH